MIDNRANTRAAYAGQLILTSEHAASMDSWATGLNNNVLVLGCSGSGKTRNFLKPNLLQCEGSYVVLDSKGRLFDEMAPFLRAHGYIVDSLDFTTMDGEIGYDPLHHVRWRGDRPLAQDIIAIASALFPRAEMGDDPFWAGAAANYVASYIAYVFEALPDREWNMASVVSVYEQACEGNAEALFADLSKQDPDSYAASLFRRARSTARADKMHSSIMGIIAANLLPLTFDGALASFRKVQQIDFCDLGRERRALFVTMDDMDRSLAPLTSLFVRQAFSSLCDFADTRCDGGRLPVPVRFMLDDFANLTLPGFDDVLSVIRSREVSCTIICQTVSQLEARYDQAVANSIIGNCDRHLVLGFQDERTAKYFALRANKLPSTLLETPAENWWLFERGRRGVCEPAYALEQHPGYREFVANCGAAADSEALTDCEEPATRKAPTTWDELMDGEAAATRKSSANREAAANLKAPAYCEAFAICEASAAWEVPEDFEAAADGEALEDCEAAATRKAPENHKAFSICEDDDLDFLPPPGPDDEIWVDTLFDTDNLDGDSDAAA